MERRDFIKTACCAFACTVIAGFGTKKVYDKTVSTDDNAFNYIEMHLADHCNLNCKYCSHFSPIADEHFYDFEVFKKDLQQLYKITDGKLERLRLMGGEPLLNPKTCDYLEFSRKCFPDTDIHIVTNGVLLNTQEDEFWNCLNKNNIGLDISRYPVEINLREIKRKSKLHKVNVFVTSLSEKEVAKTVEEIKLNFEKFNLDVTGSQKNFSCTNCFTYGCFNLYYGKIYICPVVAYIKYFNQRFNQNLEVSEGDYLDIYKLTNAKEIIEWSYKPMPFCKYCRPTESRPWESSTTHDMSEWA